MSIKLVLQGKPAFDPGRTVATVIFMAKVDPDYAAVCLGRHLSGDWGLLDDEDWEANDNALARGGRLLSAYPLPDEGAAFWIISDAEDDNGSRVTTFLLPEEY